MTRHEILKPSELSAIEAAVRQAEARTKGEIYCVVAEESSHYGETPLAWGVIVALLAPALLLLGGVHVTVPDVIAGWSSAQAGALAEAAAKHALWGVLILQAVLFVVTTALVAIPLVRRALTPGALKRARVRRRAHEQFVAKALHVTRERTGVMIFVSLHERMAELIADEGIAEHVPPHVWDKAMAALTDGLKHGRPGGGFAACVGLCGEVLAERFPADPTDNPNELPDAVVVLPPP